MTTQAKSITSIEQISFVVAAVGAVTTDTRQFITTDRMEPMWQIAVAGFAQGIGVTDQKAIDIAVVWFVAGGALVA